MQERTCPVCRTPIQGRSDKKYCSDQCRAVRNNELRNRSRETVSRISEQLRENRMILQKLCPAGRSIIPKDILSGMGYAFHIFTSIFITGNKQVYYICHDMALTPILIENKEHAVIVSWTEYRTSWDPWKYVREK